MIGDGSQRTLGFFLCISYSSVLWNKSDVPYFLPSNASWVIPKRCYEVLTTQFYRLWKKERKIKPYGTVCCCSVLGHLDGAYYKALLFLFLKD